MKTWNCKDVKCFLLDMDGTFYLGNQLIDGSLAISSIRSFPPAAISCS